MALNIFCSRAALIQSAAALTVTLAFTGCNGGAPNASPALSIVPSSQTDQLSLKALLFRESPLLAARGRDMPIVHPDHRRSWMAPTTASQALLYVSDDGTFDVYVYDYPQGTLVGTLTGFNTPDGLCVDKAGNVFVTNTGDGNVLEYAHGGTSPIATLSDSGEYPYDCAIDPLDGNLAVMNENDSSGSGGNVEIYKHAKGTPTPYSVPPDFFTVNFGDYDPQGNLFVWGTGQSASDYSVFGEMPNGSKQIMDVTLPGSIGVGATGDNVAWDGKYLTVGGGASVYQITVSGSTATLVGTTSLADASDVAQYSVLHSRKPKQGKTLVGPDCFDANVKFYNYPAGGNPTMTLTGFTLPYGSVVSKVK
jgi:hypothetical protein